MDVYKISVALAMSSNHNAVLSALAAQLLHVHGLTNNLTGGFNRLKLAVGGALSATAGVAILTTMGKLVEKTKDFSDELVKLERLGGAMGAAAASGEITKRAFDISQRVPMKVTDLMKIPGATYSIIGKEESMAVWEDLAKLSTVLRSDKHYKGDPGKDIQDLLRAGELSGRFTDASGNIDIPRLKNFLDTSTRIISATHGMVNPQTMLGMAKQGGFTMRGLSDEGFYSQAIMAQAMGGPRSGTALLSLWQQMAGGQMLKRSAQGLEDIGLLKQGEWSEGKGGHVILGDEASKRLTKLIGKDPLDFAAKLVENLKERGITDNEEQMRMVMRALGRQTTQRYSAEMVNNFHQMLAERERMMGGMGAEGSFGAIMNKSVGMNIEGMKNAWDNLLMAVAGPNSERVIKVLQSITAAINSMQRGVTGMDPETLMSIAKGIGVLGLALTGAGGVAILAALGPAGWLAAGLIGLGGVLVAFPHIFDQIKADFAKYAELIKADFAKISDAFSGFLSWLSTIADKIRGFFGGNSKGELKADPSGQGLLHLQRFDPGARAQRPQPLSLSLNIDGRTLAQTVAEIQSNLYEFPGSAPSPNGLTAWNDGDHNFATT